MKKLTYKEALERQLSIEQAKKARLYISFVKTSRSAPTFAEILIESRLNVEAIDYLNNEIKLVTQFYKW